VSGREWREASDLRQRLLGVALVLAVAAGLRFWHLASGLPGAVWAGEQDLIARVLHAMRTGDLNPHTFGSPALYFEVQLLVASARFLTGAAHGFWHVLDQFRPAEAYLWGRTASALIGTATVLLVFEAGAQWGGRHALLAAGLLAVLPAHVQASQLIGPGVLLTFFTTVALLLSLRALERGSLRTFTLAGVAAGLAAATSYRGSLVLLLPLVAVWMSSGTSAPRRSGALATIGAFALAFLLAAPYTVLDLPAFLNAAGAALAGGSTPPPLALAGALVANLAWPAFVLAIAGFILAIVRSVTGPAHARWVLLVGFPLVYLGSMSIGASGSADVLLLPVLPFVTILAAIAVISGVSLLRRFSIPRAPRQLLIAGLTIAAILPPLVSSVNADRARGRPWTSALAYGWIRAHVPAGACVAVGNEALALSGTRYRPVAVDLAPGRPLDPRVAGAAQYLVATPDAGRPAGPAVTTVYRVDPDAGRPGPSLVIYRLAWPESAGPGH